MKLISAFGLLSLLGLGLSACTMYDTFDEDLLPSSAENKQDSSEEKPDSGDSKPVLEDSTETPAADSSFDCGTAFVDARDSASYGTVKIKTQCWFDRNVNFKVADESYCFGDDDANCKKYGRLYTFDGAQVACPKGSHLPSDEEWKVLYDFVKGAIDGGKLLKDTTGWESGNGIADGNVHFAALPAGRYNSDSEKFVGLETATFWWTSTEESVDDARVFSLTSSSDVVLQKNYLKANGFSVRCLVD